MKAAFLRFNSSKQFSSSLLPRPLPSLQCTQVYIVFKCQRKKEKERERVRENPFAPECHILVREKREKEQVAELKRCRFFCLRVPVRVSRAAPLLSPLPPTSLPRVVLKCQMKQFAAERGPRWEQAALLTCRPKLFPSCPSICLSLSSSRLSPAAAVGGGGVTGGGKCCPPGRVKEAHCDTLGPFFPLEFLRPSVGA